MAVYDFIGNDGDPLPSGLTAYNGTFEIQSNALTATGSDPLGVKWLAGAESQSDGEFYANVYSDSNSSGTWGVSCRGSDNDNAIQLLLNASTGILKLFKREAGSYTQLGSDYTIPAYTFSTVYKLSIVASGSSLDAKVNDITVIAGITETFNQSATIAGTRIGTLDHRVDSLGFPDAVTDSINITTNDFAFKKATGGQATITIDGTYSGAPASIERSVDGGSWVEAIASPSGGIWSDDVTLNTGQYSISYRFSNDTGVVDTVNYITAAKHVFSCGFQAQSNMEGRMTNNQTYTDSPSGFKACMYNNSNQFSDLVDPWQGMGGSWFIRFVNNLYSVDDGPVAVVTGALGGTSAADWAKGSSLYDDLLARCNTVGGITLNFMQQGERDSTLNTLNATYESQTNQNINNVFTDLGAQTFIVPLQAITAAGYDGNGTTTGQDAIRASQIAVASTNPNVWRIGQPTTGIDISVGAPDDTGDNDGLHFKTDGAGQAVADIVYTSFLGYVSLSVTETLSSSSDYSLVSISGGGVDNVDINVTEVLQPASDSSNLNAPVTIKINTKRRIYIRNVSR